MICATCGHDIADHMGRFDARPSACRFVIPCAAEDWRDGRCTCRVFVAIGSAA